MSSTVSNNRHFSGENRHLCLVLDLWGQGEALSLLPLRLGLFSLSFLKNIHLFIWLRRVLIVVRGIFVAACRIFICGMRALSWGLWDLVP